jgi:hypothetical protein
MHKHSVPTGTVLRYSVSARIVAACIATVAWTGLLVQFAVSYQQNPSTFAVLWIIFAYFTIITNLLVAVVFTAIALDRPTLPSGWVVAGTMLSILLVGIVYGLLLHGTLEVSGGSSVANVLLHMITPVMVPLFWILFTRKGSLTWKHPILWAIYPLAYLAYDMARGSITGKFAYPFLNAANLGWTRTALNALYIAIAFMLCGYLIVWIDRRLAARSAA